jgi:hypothetical protein
MMTNDLTPDTDAAAETVAAQADPATYAPVTHPEWCQPARCTATPARCKGEAHNGDPVTVTVDGFSGLTVAASLHKPHAPWLTEVYVEVEFSGLTGDDWLPVRGRATVAAHRMVEVGQALLDLARRASAAQQQEIDDYLARLREAP